MQIPLWLFIVTCVLFLGMLVHQEVRVAKNLKFLYDTDFVLRQYIKKFGKIKFPDMEYTIKDNMET